ncbi:MAG: HD domain-containing protein, partial [Bacteroidales bacterium]
FSHTLGALFLMQEAIDTLRSKGHQISHKESQAAQIAILLHDVGHGPFSHALEHSIVENITHEDLSLLFMHAINKEMKGKLNLAIEIFNNQYHKKFLHQLVSSQLDVDRLDYLGRDSFYTGVTEGIVGTERIIKMLNLDQGNLVVDEKGLYSIEKFILSRRLMYWQVYLHKTSVSAELMLINLLKRAKELALTQILPFGSDEFAFFLQHNCSKEEFTNDENILAIFSLLDDSDIWLSIKKWMQYPDKILSDLARRLYERRLFKTEISNHPFSESYQKEVAQKLMSQFKIKKNEIPYFMYTKTLENKAYSPGEEGICILKKDESVVDISSMSELLDTHFLSKTDRKYLLCYPK